MTTASKRVALVTGATDGLGKGVAFALAKAYDAKARARLRALSDRACAV
jgi:NAD(P)-dependent dehydrogenase (short-subunit alcohol dehydrogenase family)